MRGLLALVAAVLAYNTSTEAWLSSPSGVGRGGAVWAGSRGPQAAAKLWSLHTPARLVACAAGAQEGGSAGGDDEEAEDEVKQAVSEADLRAFRARLSAFGLDYGEAGKTPDQSAPPPEAVKGGAASAVPAAAAAAAAAGERWAHALPAVEQGCLLLANEALFQNTQQYFRFAVLLIIEHGPAGTAGLILNQPTATTMGEITMDDPSLTQMPGLEDNTLYFGGDVGRRRTDGMDTVNLMHGRDDVAGIEVIKGVKLGGLEQALALVAEGKADPEEFKFFCRFCGWGPGQLSREIAQGAWYVAACDAATVLSQYNTKEQPGRLWREVMVRMGGNYRAIAEKMSEQL